MIQNAKVFSNGRVIGCSFQRDSGNWSESDYDIVFSGGKELLTLTVNGVEKEISSIVAPQHYPVKDFDDPTKIEFSITCAQRIPKGAAVALGVIDGFVSDGVDSSVAETIVATNNSAFSPLASNSRFFDPQALILDTSPLAYVDPINGNDLTGVVYVQTDTEVGGVATLPTGAIMPFATLQAAEWAATGRASNSTNRSVNFVVLVKRGTITPPAAGSSHLNFGSCGGAGPNARGMVIGYGPRDSGDSLIEHDSTCNKFVNIRKYGWIYIGGGIKLKPATGFEANTLAMIGITTADSGVVEGLMFDDLIVEGGNNEGIVIDDANGSHLGIINDISVINTRISDIATQDAIYVNGGERQFVRNMHYENFYGRDAGNDGLEHVVYEKGVRGSTQWFCLGYESDQGNGKKADHQQGGETAFCIFRTPGGHSLESNPAGGFGVAVDRTDDPNAGAACRGVTVRDSIIDSTVAWAVSTNSAIDCELQDVILLLAGGGIGLNCRKNDGSGAASNTVQDGRRLKLRRVTMAGTDFSGLQIDMPISDDHTNGVAAHLATHDLDFESGIIVQDAVSPTKAAIAIVSNISQTYASAKAGNRVSMTIGDVVAWNASGPVVYDDGDDSDLDLSEFETAIGSDLVGLREENPGMSSPGSGVEAYAISLGHTLDEFLDEMQSRWNDSSVEDEYAYTLPAIANFIHAAHDTTLADKSTVQPANNWPQLLESLASTTVSVNADGTILFVAVIDGAWGDVQGESSPVLTLLVADSRTITVDTSSVEVVVSTTNQTDDTATVSFDASGEIYQGESVEIILCQAGILDDMDSQSVSVEAGTVVANDSELTSSTTNTRRGVLAGSIARTSISRTSIANPIAR